MIVKSSEDIRIHSRPTDKTESTVQI